MRFKNQTGLIDSTVQPSILVLWCGWVGSMAAFYLSKMWLNDITLVDKDEVEDHNVASQMYKSTDIGKTKVWALKNTILEFSDVECKVHNEWWTEEFADTLWDYDIIILAIDDMDIRKRVVDYYKEDPFVWIVESRMWWTDYIIHSFSPSTQYDFWIWSWFPQSEADPINCTQKSICFNTGLIGSKIAEQVWKYITKKDPEFFITYSSIPEIKDTTQDEYEDWKNTNYSNLRKYFTDFLVEECWYSRITAEESDDWRDEWCKKEYKEYEANLVL